jgi:hypothetical protein
LTEREFPQEFAYFHVLEHLMGRTRSERFLKRMLPEPIHQALFIVGVAYAAGGLIAYALISILGP